MTAPIGLYVHIPFCARKCPYCDFNTYAGMEARHPSLVDALCTEMAAGANRFGARPAGTVFIGGGTPTVLTADQLATMMEAIRSCFSVREDAEITCEANPGTVDAHKFEILRDLGVNRLSLGAQSFDPGELGFLGRLHGVGDIGAAVDAARAAGFDNLNLDLMFGLPDQSPETWRRSLARAVALAPEHLSLYGLIVESGTPLAEWVASGDVAAPDDDEAAGLYETAMAMLGDAGYRHYEVSNWALDSASTADAEPRGLAPHRACQHNLVYWRNGEYLGFGPGAHSHLRLADEDGKAVGHRWSNVRAVPDYVRRVAEGRSTTAFEETLTERTAMGETMLLGLRLCEEGVADARFRARHGTGLHSAYGPLLARLVGLGLLEHAAGHVRLTRRGLMVGNQVFAEFVSDGA